MELIVSLLTSALALTLGLAVLLKNRRSGSNVYLALLIFSLSLYPIFNYLALASTTDVSAERWSQFILLTAIPVGPLFFSFVKVFPTSRFKFNIKLQIFIWLWALFNCILALSGLIFEHVSVEGGKLILIPGPAVASFGLLQVIMIFASLYILIKKYLHSKGKSRLQLQYIVFGITLSFSLMIIGTILLPLLFGVTFFVPLSPLFLLFGVFMVALSVTRHQLLDIRPIIARAVSFLLLLLFFAFVFSLAIIFLSTWVLNISLPMPLFLLTLFLSLFIAVSFQPLSKYLRKVTDSILFSDYYNSEELLYRVAVISGSSLLIEELARKILQELIETLKLQNGFIILADEKSVYSVISEGNRTGAEIDEKVILDIFTSNHETLVLAEQTENKKTHEFFTSHEIGLISKLTKEKTIIGYIALGEKLSGDSYSRDDIRVIEIISPQAAVAIQNARSYEEIQRFNITLKEEVDRATESLKSANQRLRELDKLKDEFVSLASHELRTPLTSIKYYIWMTLKGKGGKLATKQKEYLDRAYISTSRLTKLVNDMLNISRIESNRIILNVHKANIRKLAKEVADETKPKADERSIRILVSSKCLQKGTQKSVSFPDVLVDSDKIKEVLVNLVGNAIKFTPKKGQITIWFECTQDMVIVHVKDTGIGIDPKKISELFKKFGMVRESYAAYKDSSQGTGLGLYICKSIIQLHGGTISANSEGTNKGTDFSFTIPHYSATLQKQFAKKFSGKTDAGIIMTQIMAE